MMPLLDTTAGVGFGFVPMTEPGTGIAEARSMLDLARHVDGRGFDVFFAVDHLHLAGDRYLAEPRDVDRPYQLECWTLLASIAAVTQRIRVGPLVTPLPLRHPAVVAKMGATIDLLSAGRLLMAVGTGWKAPEYESYNLPYEESFKRRFAQTLEGVEVMQALWTHDGPVDYAGSHYRLDGAKFYPKPAQQPRPPVWFGGSGPSALEAVASLGDGWTPAAPHYDAVTPEVYRTGLQTIRDKASAYGRDPDSITPGILLNTSISADRETAMTLASAQQLRDDWAGKTIPEQQESGVLAAGTPGDVVEHLKRYYEAGARFFTVCPIPMRMDNAWRTATLYMDYVIPVFKEWAATQASKGGAPA